MRVRALFASAVVSAAMLVPSQSRAADDDSSSESSDDDSSHAEKDQTAHDDKPKAKDSDDSDSEGYEGQVQFSMTSTLASYSELSFTLTHIPLVDGTGVQTTDPQTGAPLWFDTTGTLTDTTWGPSTNPVTFELSYGISRHALLGALLEIGGSTLNTKMTKIQIDDVLQMARFLVGPRFEFVFSTSGKIRPFAMGVAGFTWAPQQNTYRSISLSGFQLLGGAGLHWQLAPSFSIDPAFRVGGGYGAGTVNEPLPYGKIKAHGSLLTASLLIGVTGWLL